MDDQDEKRERVLLRPWLQNLIESGSIPGLEWMDDNKTMFKVPWKHRSKKSWSLRHSSIFLEWAKNTGRWSEGDPEPNYAQLKTRLRCAFNKAPDIEEMKELHRTKAEEPFKVYKFIPRKESKLYPFGRRPLRKTTVPITVRKRHYLISRIAQGYNGVSGGRRILLSDSTSVKIKEEKEDISVSGSSYDKMTAEDSFSETAGNQSWKNWLPEHNQRLDAGSINAWSNVYNSEGDGQISRNLPLIVEEANTNSMDLELPQQRDRKVESSIPSSILPEIIRDRVAPLPESVGVPFISIPRLLGEDSTTKDRNRRSQDIPSSSSLTPEKLEYLHSWHRDSAAIYATSRFIAHPSNNSNIPDGVPRILPEVDRDFNRCDTNTTTPACWSHSAPEVKSNMANHSPDHFTAQEPEVVIHPKSSLVPAARLFPLKNRYIVSRKAFDLEKSSVDGRPVVQEKLNAVVKPNAIAQPRIAVAAPYDGKSSLENEQKFTSESVLGEVSKAAALPELEVIDLSARVSANESRVLDLTKKMVVTPFERDCHMNMWESTKRNCLSDMGKDVDENLVSSDQSTTASEILKCKADYKRKKQLIVTKTMLLVEKERELKAREKQLAAREEALFWKETYLHRVMSSIDNGAIPASKSGSMTHFIPSVEAHRSAGLIGSPEVKEAGLKYLPSSSYALFSPQSSSALLPGVLAGKHQQPLAAGSLARPEHLNNVPGFLMSSRDAVTSASSFSTMSRCLPVSLPQPRTFGESVMTPKSSVLLSRDQMTYNRGNDLRFEPETYVALGDAYPARKSYPLMVKKSQSEARLSLTTVHEAPTQALLMTRKRGRPKGSKNKAKLAKSVSSTSPAIRQMPPLLVIQSPSMKDPATSTPIGQQAFPFHVTRNESVSEIDVDHHHEDLDSTATVLDGSCLLDSKGCRNVETNRILPPVTSDSNWSSSLLVAPAETRRELPAISKPRPDEHSSLFDHAPDKDVMPETVRQLLVSASKPVSTYLPPLSPSKSPDRSSSPTEKVVYVYQRDEKTPVDEQRVVTSIC